MNPESKDLSVFVKSPAGPVVIIISGTKVVWSNLGEPFHSRLTDPDSNIGQILPADWVKKIRSGIDEARDTLHEVDLLFEETVERGRKSRVSITIVPLIQPIVQGDVMIVWNRSFACFDSPGHTPSAMLTALARCAELFLSSDKVDSDSWVWKLMGEALRVSHIFVVKMAFTRHEFVGLQDIADWTLNNIGPGFIALSDKQKLIETIRQRLTDLYKGNPVFLEPGSPSNKGVGKAQYVAAPIIIDRGLWGLLVCGSGQKGVRWSESKMQAISTFAHLTGSALKREIAEKNANRKEMGYKAIFEGSFDAIVIHDPLGTLVDANPAACRLSEYDRSEVIGMNILQFMPEDRLQIASQLLAELSTEKGLRFDIQFITKSRRLLTVEVSVSPMPGHSLYQAHIRDITEKRNFEARLLQQLLIMDQVSDAIITVDLNMNIVTWNKPASLIYGWCAEEVIGRKIDELLETEFIAMNQIQARREMFEQGYWKGEIRQKRKDGNHIFVEASVSWLRDENDKIIGGMTINRDITTRKEWETLLIEVTEREQMRFGQELHDGLCQDLKSLEFEATLLENRLRQQQSSEISPAKSLVRKIHDSVLTAYHIARNALPMGPDAGFFSRALENLVEQIGNENDKTIVTNIDRALQPTYDNQAYNLYKIAREALLNATRHSRASLITLSWTGSKDKMVLSVTDNGIGITRQAASNNRIGIKIMYSRAVSIGGQISITTPPEGGTNVLVILETHTGSKK